MIGKISSGSDFGGCVGYALAEKEKNKEARLLYSEGLLVDSTQSIIEGFECQRRMNHRVEKWVGHISLSYSPEDSVRLSDEAMVKLAHEYMAKMGIRNTQYIITRHLDKEHPHCHIVYNRVDNDGKCISDSNERLRNKEVCKELKRKYGLTFGEGKDNVKTERLRGRSKTRQEIYLAVQAAKKTAKDWTTFQRELAKNGISVRKKFRRGSTEVEGLSYVKDDRRFKASQIDRDGKCSYSSICKALDRNKNFRPQSVGTAPKMIISQSQPEPNIIEKTVSAGTEVAEGISGGLSDIIKVGPGFDAQEDEFYREMQRRKKKKKGLRL